MKKILGYFLCSILAFAMGAFCIYYFYKDNPQVVTKVEKSVTITDKGISEGIDNIYETVVIIQTYKNKKLTGIGSGFIYNDEGYILTNYHVIEDSDKLKLTLASGEKVDVKVVGSDEYSDIAVLQIDKKYITNTAKIGKSNNTKIGDTVFAVGSPMNISYSGTVTRGILSAKNRIVDMKIDSTKSNWAMNVIQTDAAINPGNSGGPLCNVNGEVIGINAMKIVQSDVEGISFAIPIEDAMKYAERIINNKNLKGSYLGIQMGELTAKYTFKKFDVTIDPSIEYGVVVLGVNPSSPAEKAGIKKGDVIIQIDNVKVDDTVILKYYLYRYNPNEETTIKIIRNKEVKTLNVVLGESE